MSYYVFRERLYQICEVYIDDLLIYGNDDDSFVQNVRTIFQKCREKNVTLSAKKLYLSFDTVQFVGHELDSTGINMTQKRIESTIQFAQPNSLTELYSFLGLVNYFRDHIPQHSLVAQPLHAMVSVSAKAKQKQITWTEEGRRAFSTLKSLVNKCPKLYIIDTKLPIILYTDASDYAHGAYLCQLQKQEDGTTVEFPLGFLSGTFWWSNGLVLG